MLLVTCYVMDFLTVQHLTVDPINSHLLCVLPFIVSQPTVRFATKNFSATYVLRNLWNYLLEVEIKIYNTNIKMRVHKF